MLWKPKKMRWPWPELGRSATERKLNYAHCFRVHSVGTVDYNLPLTHAASLTTHHHLVPRLKMRGAIHQLPHMPSWLKQAQRQIFFCHMRVC